MALLSAQNMSIAKIAEVTFTSLDRVHDWAVAHSSTVWRLSGAVTEQRPPARAARSRSTRCARIPIPPP
jgi:hypothetical protein